MHVCVKNCNDNLFGRLMSCCHSWRGSICVKAWGACHTLHATEKCASRHVSHGIEEHVTRHASPVVAVDHPIRVEHGHDFEHEIVTALIYVTRLQPPPHHLSVQTGPHQIVDNPLQQDRTIPAAEASLNQAQPPNRKSEPQKLRLHYHSLSCW